MDKIEDNSILFLKKKNNEGNPQKIFPALSDSWNFFLWKHSILGIQV